MTPFAEGYIAAARESLPPEHRDAPFADATLEVMLGDSASMLATGFYESTAESGRDCWVDRSASFTTLPCCDPAHMTADFPPILLSLSDQGKIEVS